MVPANRIVGRVALDGQDLPLENHTLRMHCRRLCGE